MKDKRYQNLSIEEKENKQQYGRERYKSLSEDEKNNWLSIEKNIIKSEKNALLYHKKVF